MDSRRKLGNRQLAAFAGIPMGEHNRRLDSWKQIAEYLGRDVRTAMRWSKSQGLPVRRVAGTGRSVFAFSNEIDAWLAGHPAGTPAVPPLPVPAPARARRPVVAVAASVATIVLVIAVAVVAFPIFVTSTPVRASATARSVTVTDSRGAERVVHAFDPAITAVLTKAALLTDLEADGAPDVLVGVALYDDAPGKRARSGELLNIDPDGGLRWRFGFDDRLRFRDTTFTGPWGLTDWQVGPAASPARIAVTAHDSLWWGSMAAVIDHSGRRLSTFVNPGWIESLLWLDRDRIAVAGFSNARDAAILGVVDPDRPLGQAPGSEGTPFHCADCPGDAPLFYAAFPRSELNVLTASRFNRAQVAWAGDHLLVTTIEIAGDPLAATALYEFDRDLRLKRATFGDVYWDTHRRLELEGRLTHSRAACPERDGPPAIDVWSAAGWRRIRPPR